MSEEIRRRRPFSEEHKRKIGLANSVALKGRKLPKEVRMKISGKLKGRRLTELHKKHLSIALGGKLKSEEHKRKLSEALRGKPQPWHRGEKCHFWKGGMAELSKRIKISFRYSRWRTAVFEKDDWTCQSCGRRGGIILHPHHREDFASILERNSIKTIEEALDCKRLWNVDNGITLCQACHKQTASYGWNRYNFRNIENISRKREAQHKPVSPQEE